MQPNNLKITQGDTEFELIEYKSDCMIHNPSTPSLVFNGRLYYIKAIPNKPKEVPTPDYEILSFYYQTKERNIANRISNGRFVIGFNSIMTENEMLTTSWEINSVQRISDGEVFCIDDCAIGGKIEGFTIDGTEMFAKYRNGRSQLLKCIQKLKPNIPSFTPFITEDGYNVTDKSTVLYAAREKIYNSIPSKKNRWFSWLLNAASYTGDKDTKYFFKKENRDRWVEENTPKKPYYEIVEMRKLIRFHKPDEEGDIHSVKRLSDAEVFTVSEVCQDEVGHVFKPIKKFFIKEDVMYAQFNCGYGNNDFCLGLNALVKYTKKPLLKLDDGTDMLEGDTIHIAHIGYSEPRSAIVAYNFNQLNLINAKNSGYYWFSTKEKAQEWLDENKPRFSLSDIRNNFKNESSYSYTIASIIKTLKDLKP